MPAALRSDRIVATLDRLRRRIEERFPGSSLGAVATEIAKDGRAIEGRLRRLERPHGLLRAAVALFVLAIVGPAVWFLVTGGLGFEIPKGMRNFWGFVQAFEAGISALVFAGAALVFLGGLERRRRRGRMLSSLHELRAWAHVVDMHQLTKDPEMAGKAGRPTASSPDRRMDAFELGRYLDYCSELLSLLSKLAALHLERFQDAEVADAVDRIEAMTTGLSRKIWQKIVLLHEES